MILSALDVSRTLANPSRGFLRGTPGYTRTMASSVGMESVVSSPLMKNTS